MTVVKRFAERNFLTLIGGLKFRSVRWMVWSCQQRMWGCGDVSKVLVEEGSVCNMINREKCHESKASLLSLQRHWCFPRGPQPSLFQISVGDVCDAYTTNGCENWLMTQALVDQRMELFQGELVKRSLKQY